MLINYISSKQIIGRFLKELAIEDTTYVDDIPMWIEDALEIMGVPNYYVNKFAVKQVESYKTSLPCDIQFLHGVWVSHNLNPCIDKSSLRRLFIRNNPLIGEAIKTAAHEAAYGMINNQILHTSFEKGYVYFAYKGLPLDNEGFPLVPKNSFLQEALQYWFIYKMSFSGYIHPVVSRQEAYQLWNQNYPKASNDINWMDLQDMQDFTELWTNPLLGDLHNNNYIH
jgi:hypothetical protein